MAIVIMCNFFVILSFAELVCAHNYICADSNFCLLTPASKPPLRLLKSASQRTITKRYPGQRTSLCLCVEVSTRAALLVFFLSCTSTSPARPRVSTKHWTCATATFLRRSLLSVGLHSDGQTITLYICFQKADRKSRLLNRQ